MKLFYYFANLFVYLSAILYFTFTLLLLYLIFLAYSVQHLKKITLVLNFEYLRPELKIEFLKNSAITSISGEETLLKPYFLITHLHN